MGGYRKTSLQLAAEGPMLDGGEEGVGLNKRGQRLRTHCSYSVKTTRELDL
jgi:hypothetical protein